MQKGKSERTKVYLIVGLGLVLCVVSYFRLFNRETIARTDGRSSATVATVPQIVAPVSAHPQQTGLQELQRPEFVGGAVRNIFEPVKPDVSADTKSKVPGDPRPLEVALVLNGLVYSVNNPIAVINGQFLRVGDRIGGYKVVRMGPKEVVMRFENREIVLGVASYGQE